MASVRDVLNVNSINSAIGRGGAKLGKLTSGITKEIKSFTDPVNELLGVKGELYTIGYIAAEWQEKSSLLKSGLGGNLIKAYQNAMSQFNGVAQSLGFSGTGFGMPIQNATTVDGFFGFEGDMGVTLPSYPIMFGTNINMHRVRTPDVVSQEIFISSRMSDDIIEKTTKILTNNDLFSLVTGTDGDTARVRRKINELRYLMQVGRPFTYYTPHAVYENMVLRRIRPKNTEQTMDGFSAVLEFQEIIYYTDVNDGKSRCSKKALSKAGEGVLNSVAQAVGWNR